MNSLRQKLFFGYATIVALVVALSLLSLIELRLLEQKIVAGARIAQFFDISLEIRRFEKNYFLYHQDSDLTENRTYVHRARSMLREHAEIFAALGNYAQVTRLGDDLDRYAMLIDQYAASSNASGNATAGSIRKIGKEIVTVAEDWAKTERKTLQTQLDRHRLMLLGSVAFIGLAVIGIGGLLARRVLRPLKEMERKMKEVASGHRAKLEMSSDEREFKSLTHAFNHVLHELEIHQRQLVHSEKLVALGTLLSGVAHELNNPLSNIATSTQILAEEAIGENAADEVATFRRELITQIDEETWRARHIVRSLLDYARDREFHHEALPLAPLVEDTLRLVRGQIPASITITVQIPETLAASCDRQRLQQVLLNLVRNAADAMPDGGEVRISARLTHEPCVAQPPERLVFGQCTNEAEAVEIEVNDNGSGIASATLPRIFDPFFTTKEVGKGMGLGLFIVFEIIEEHGGCIAVESKDGRGTTFTIRLPLEKS
ncbi:MAG: HAMP domain-containing sensor histidine kinase [Rhodocyclaceae bacterium]|jgi:signal transduction histidine kinase|nr:HAMP domain-containing sensor histidine kinase [Rhodocyclaceae bacterium]